MYQAYPPASVRNARVRSDIHSACDLSGSHWGPETHPDALGSPCNSSGLGQHVLSSVVDPFRDEVVFARNRAKRQLETPYLKLRMFYYEDGGLSSELISAMAINNFYGRGDIGMWKPCNVRQTNQITTALKRCICPATCMQYPSV
jgi:hypothetical protein